MKNLTLILFTIIFCSCNEEKAPVEQLSKVDSLNKIATYYISAYKTGKSIDKYIKYFDDDIEYDKSGRPNLLLTSVNYSNSTELEYIHIEEGDITPELHVFYTATQYVGGMGPRTLIAFDMEGSIYFVLGFDDSQYDVLLKRNMKHIETIEEVNQIIDLYNELNYLFDVFEIKKAERKNDSLALSMLNQTKIISDTIIVERLLYADQLERYLKQTFRITKDLDFDSKIERLLMMKRE